MKDIVKDNMLDILTDAVAERSELSVGVASLIEDGRYREAAEFIIKEAARGLKDLHEPSDPGKPVAVCAKLEPEPETAWACPRPTEYVLAPNPSGDIYMKVKSPHPDMVQPCPIWVAMTGGGELQTSESNTGIFFERRPADAYIQELRKKGLHGVGIVPMTLKDNVIVEELDEEFFANEEV